MGQDHDPRRNRITVGADQTPPGDGPYAQDVEHVARDPQALDLERLAGSENGP